MKLFSILSFFIVSQVIASSYLSYNTGLAHKFVHYAKERRSHIIEALKSEKSQVLCLQEVWTKKDRKKIIKELKEIYPYAHYNKIMQTRTDKAPSCKVKDIFGDDKFVSCMNSKCKDLDGDQHTDCILDRCGKELRFLRDNKPQCAQALMAQVGKKPLSAILTLINPIIPAGLYVYKGSDGLLMLSKTEMKEKSSLDFSDISTLNRRRALTAKVDGKSLACTHLAADLEKSAPYTGPFASWKEEHREQSKRLIEASKSKGFDILMGDFNCSFADPKNLINAEVEENCRLFKVAGYSDPIAVKSPECTYCTSNNLNDEDDNNSLIDHIFVKNAKVNNTAIRYKQEVYLEKEGLYSNLSDHFAVFLSLE